jgi:hypothetical protein
MKTKTQAPRNPSGPSQRGQTENIEALRRASFEAGLEVEDQINAAIALMGMLADELHLMVPNQETDERLGAAIAGCLHMSATVGGSLRECWEEYFNRVREERELLAELAAR